MSHTDADLDVLLMVEADILRGEPIATIRQTWSKQVVIRDVGTLWNVVIRSNGSKQRHVLKTGGNR